MYSRFCTFEPKIKDSLLIVILKNRYLSEHYFPNNGMYAGEVISHLKLIVLSALGIVKLECIYNCPVRFKFSKYFNFAYLKFSNSRFWEREKMTRLTHHHQVSVALTVDIIIVYVLDNDSSAVNKRRTNRLAPIVVQLRTVYFRKKK